MEAFILCYKSDIIVPQIIHNEYNCPSKFIVINIIIILYEICALKIRMLPSITSYMRSRAITTVIISRWSFMAYAFTSSSKSWWKLFSHILYSYVTLHVYLNHHQFLRTNLTFSLEYRSRVNNTFWWNNNNV